MFCCWKTEEFLRASQAHKILHFQVNYRGQQERNDFLPTHLSPSGEAFSNNKIVLSQFITFGYFSLQVIY